MRKLSRPTENVLSAVVGAAIVAVLSASTAVAVATTDVSITSPVTGKKAHVTNQQSLVTSERDPINGTYARVGNGGTVMVESRAGALSGAFNKTFTVTALGVYKIAEVTGPARIAITEVTLSGRDVDFDAEVYLQSWTQDTGTAACSTQSTGWTKTELRRFSFPMYETTQVTFDGPPLVIPPAPAGKQQCVAFVVHARGTESRIFLGATGYTVS